MCEAGSTGRAHPVGKQRVGWHLEGMVGEDGEGSGPWGWGERQGMRLWKREGRMGKGSAGSGSVRSSGEREYGWTDKGVWGCWSVREVG